MILPIFNILGQKVKTVMNKHAKSGLNEFVFDGTNLASGSYILLIKSDKAIKSKKIELIK